MANWLALVQNETLKVWKKKRFAVIVIVLLVLIPIFVYAQLKIAQNNAAKFADWRSVQQQRITDNMNALSSDRIPEEWKKWRRSLVQQLQYYLDHDVNPDSPNAVTFTSTFLENSVSLFIPLMVLAIASDLVSSERASGTIKMLLTRPVRRWRILASKLIALVLYVSLIIPTAAALCYLIAGLAFGYEGWGAPVFVGFEMNGTAIDTSSVHAISQGSYLLMEMGLAWFSALIVALIAFMASVLLQSAAASLVAMMAAVISGTILANMASNWHSAKYLFNVNLNLTSYLQGTPPPIKGMSLGFSLAVLTVWGAISLTTAFAVFTKRDVLN